MFKSISLLIIRGESPKILMNQYERLGLEFTQERHGNGPVHYSSNLSGSIFEIYPGSANSHIVGGFGVDSITDFMNLCDSLEFEYRKVGDLIIFKDIAGNQLLVSQI